MVDVILSELTILDIQGDNIGLDFPLLFKVHRIWSVYNLENSLNFCHQMSDFKAIVHQMRFRLEICPRPHWGSSQRSPDPQLDLKGPISNAMGVGGVWNNR